MLTASRRLGSRLRALPAPVWLILALAFALRSALVIGTPDYAPDTDAAEYDRVARSFADGDGYPESILALAGGPSAFTSPGYPLALSAVYLATGDSLLAARLSQCLIGTIIVGLIGLIAWQLWNSRAALVAMALAAVFPFLFFNEVGLVAEPLFTALILGSVAAVLEYRRREAEGRWLIIIAGVCVGYAAITRPSGILVLLPLAAGVLAAGPGPRVDRTAFAAPAALAAAALLLMAPWVIRNALVMDAFIPFNTRDGQALIRTYNEESLHAYIPSTPQNSPAGERIFTRPGISELEANRAYREAAFEFMRDHPQYVAATLIRNTLRAAQLINRHIVRLSIQYGTGLGIPTWFASLALYSFFPVAGLALVAILTGGVRRRELFVWAVPLVLFASVVWFADGRARYRSPSDPYIVLLAAYAVITIQAKLSNLRDRRASEP